MGRGGASTGSGETLRVKVEEAKVKAGIMGSDHCLTEKTL